MTTPELTPDGMVTVTEDTRDWDGDGPHPDQRLINAAGGPDKFSPQYRRWI